MSPNDRSAVPGEGPNLRGDRGACRLALAVILVVHLVGEQ